MSISFLTTKILLASGLRDLILYRLNRATNSDASCCTEAYQNGREQGFTINLISPKCSKSVTLSECRNTDGIVVYHNNNSNRGLSEEAFAKAKYFYFNEYDKVVEYCVDYLTSDKSI